MSRIRWHVAATAVAFCLAAFTGLVLAGGVWVSEDGDEHALHEDHHLFFGDEGEKIDLADLRDGETRTFGEGERQFTATREGDEVTLTGPAGKEEKIHLVCRLGTDSCEVITLRGDSGHTVLMVKKQQHCEDGEGDCRHISMLAGVDEAVGALARVFTLDAFTDCDEDEEDCTAAVKRIHLGPGETHAEIFVETMVGAGDEDANVLVLGHGGHGNLLYIGEEGHVTLRCPEGDTTMLVPEEEAEDGFRCPKHSLALEKVPGPGKIHKIRVHEKGSGEEY